MTATTSRSEVDPRVDRSRRAVLAAALDELGEVGYGTFAMGSLARRAGVARSTIYRHWPDKLAVIVDALRVLNRQPRSDAPSDPRDTVVGLVEHLVDVMADSTLSRCSPALVDAAERHPEVRRFHHRYSRDRRRRLTAAIAAAQDEGSVDPAIDPDLAATALAGAVVYCRLMTPRPFGADRVRELVDLVIGPRAGGDRRRS